MRKLALRGLVLTVVIGMLGLGSYAIAGGGSKNFKGKNMNGYEENIRTSPPWRRGSFEAELSDDGTKLAYELSYSGLEGTVSRLTSTSGRPRSTAASRSGSARPAANRPDPLADTPTARSPARSPVRSTSTDVIGPDRRRESQPGEFAEILAAMRAGHAYANVHSSKFGGGEIRAQINDNKRGND